MTNLIKFSSFFLTKNTHNKCWFSPVNFFFMFKIWDRPIRSKPEDRINKNHMTKYFWPYDQINRNTDDQIYLPLITLLWRAIKYRRSGVPTRGSLLRRYLPLVKLLWMAINNESWSIKLVAFIWASGFGPLDQLAKYCSKCFFTKHILTSYITLLSVILNALPWNKNLVFK